MQDISDNYYEQFIAGARQVAAHGLVICGAGNLSWRVSDELLLITTTNSWMARLTRDDVAVGRIADGATVGKNEPSKEIGFHAGIFRERPEMDVVLHVSSPHATAIACSPDPWPDFYIIPEIPYYIGPIGSVPFLTPGGTELAQAVTAAMKQHDLVMLRNHGQVVVARDLDRAIAKAAYFELACQILLTGAGRVEPMPADNVTELLEQGRAHRAKA